MISEIIYNTTKCDCCGWVSDTKNTDYNENFTKYGKLDICYYCTASLNEILISFATDEQKEKAVDFLVKKREYDRAEEERIDRIKRMR